MENTKLTQRLMRRFISGMDLNWIWRNMTVLQAINHPNPAQQRPYVIRSNNGRIVDVNGNPVASNDPAAHIPFSDFRFD
ncbi:hypothetical protein [Phyllobacterium phragmitis]|uniref:hypothetical protein n=1 Tax=Phyllobacterium phragmitis TaxID=2670329 RepID=UPI001304BF71|nr:hypothetical protein [Phyllobacterium phragmitis]